MWQRNKEKQGLSAWKMPGDKKLLDSIFQLNSNVNAVVSTWVYKDLLKQTKINY